jgi:hypothetical protein
MRQRRALHNDVAGFAFESNEGQAVSGSGGACHLGTTFPEVIRRSTSPYPMGS